MIDCGKNSQGSSLIVKTVSRLVARVMLVFACYVTLHGAVTHGGGFSGGLIIALVFILIVLAYGRAVGERMMTISRCVQAMCLGGIAFLVIALGGYLSGSFLKNFLGAGKPFSIWSGGIMPFFNIFLAIFFGAGLYGIFSALLRFKPKGEEKK